MKIFVSTPYRENSIMSIARAAATDHELCHFYTTLYLASYQAKAQRIPWVGSRLAQELGRRAFLNIPSDRVTAVATLPELVHVGVRRLLGMHGPTVTSELMYWVKARFDHAVAKRLLWEHPDVLIGMYGASLESFWVTHQHGGMTVLNFVNSHPAEHNRYLSELAGLHAPHHELIPDWMVDRVEHELELADLVLVPSNFVAKQLRAHHVASEKIAVLPYGVDLHAFHPDDLRTFERKTVECLFVGQISHRKGIRVLIEAALRSQGMPVRFHLIGPVVSSKLLQNLPDNIFYEGTRLPGSVAETMRKADLFVLPSFEDAYALVVLEAMASGLPLITTDHNGASELLENGHDGLIVPAGDVNALAKAIYDLVEKSELRSKLGNAARKKVEGTYSWEHYGKSVLQAIAVACERHNLSRSASSNEDPSSKGQDAYEDLDNRR
ncbi:MAG: glycosyltransferase family 4 protein [Firmicutes bacterium]|nr:glycosyltransferase family 4 protein [Bacillota bacterium]